MSLDISRTKALNDAPHGFFGRTGGVSTGLFASLNVGLGSSDDMAAVTENRRRVVEALLPRATLVTCYQVHSAHVVTVDAPFADDSRPQADALVTRTPGLLLGILTADCAPVLFADVKAGVAGAAHAGWKGALGGVTDATIMAMEVLGADRANIAAAIGPCIAQASYEVSDGFRAPFIAQDANNQRFFTDGRAGHAQFDLEGYVAHRLEAADITTVERLKQDTFAQPDRYFSYRRATLNGEPDYGRQISLIGLPS